MAVASGLLPVLPIHEDLEFLLEDLLISSGRELELVRIHHR